MAQGRNRTCYIVVKWMKKVGSGRSHHLQVLWELCPTSITRVHRDEVPNGRVHGDVLVHELKTLLLLPNSILDAFDLRRVGNELKYLSLSTLTEPAQQ